MNLGDPVKYSFINEQGQPVTVEGEIANIYTTSGYTEISVAWFDADDNLCIEHWIPAHSKSISYGDNQKTD